MEAEGRKEKSIRTAGEKAYFLESVRTEVKTDAFMSCPGAGFDWHVLGPRHGA